MGQDGSLYLCIIMGGMVAFFCYNIIIFIIMGGIRAFIYSL
jgi:hypothetical protein